MLGNRNETVCHINVLEYHMDGDIGHCCALGGNMCEVGTITTCWEVILIELDAT